MDRIDLYRAAGRLIRRRGGDATAYSVRVLKTRETPRWLDAPTRLREWMQEALGRVDGLGSLRRRRVDTQQEAIDRDAQSAAFLGMSDSHGLGWDVDHLHQEILRLRDDLFVAEMRIWVLERAAARQMAH
jgi:hypothetical protein